MSANGQNHAVCCIFFRIVSTFLNVKRKRNFYNYFSNSRFLMLSSQLPTKALIPMTMMILEILKDLKYLIKISSYSYFVSKHFFFTFSSYYCSFRLYKEMFTVYAKLYKLEKTFTIRLNFILYRNTVLCLSGLLVVLTCSMLIKYKFKRFWTNELWISNSGPTSSLCYKYPITI